MIQGLSHLAIAVPDIEKARNFYKDVLGATVSTIEPLAAHGVQTCFVDIGGIHIELITPFGDDSPIQKFLSKNPKGAMHHICFTVPDIHRAVQNLTAKGCQVLGEPKIGAKGHLVAFLHPKDTYGVLMELEENAP